MKTPNITYSYAGQPLTAKTDLGARRQVRKIDKEAGCELCKDINFFRRSDGCHGWIEK